MISRLYMAVTCLYCSRAQNRPCRIELFVPHVKATHHLSDKLCNDRVRASSGSLQERPFFLFSVEYGFCETGDGLVTGLSSSLLCHSGLL